jgi:hypothetical protein
MAVGADTTRGRWPLSWAFALGAVIGAVAGLVWGWIDYGTFDPARFYNHVIGGIVLAGFAFAGVAAVRNWLRRNPV